MVNNYSGWHRLHEDLHEKIIPPAIERLQNIKIPVLILVGEKDLSYYHDISEVLLKKITNSKKNDHSRFRSPSQSRKT